MKESAETDTLLTVREVAAALRLSQVAVRSLIKSGRLYAYRFGLHKAYRVYLSDLNKFIRANRVSA